MSNPELSKHDHILFGLVSQYQTLALIGLGKIQNPATGQIERDLDQARAFIDVLEMLKAKCRTDTPEALLKVLDSAVMDLQLNYMDELKRQDGTTDAAGDADGTAAAADAAEPEKSDSGESA